MSIGVLYWLDVVDVGDERNCLPKLRYNLRIGSGCTVSDITARVFKINIYMLSELKEMIPLLRLKWNCVASRCGTKNSCNRAFRYGSYIKKSSPRKSTNTV